MKKEIILDNLTMTDILMRYAPRDINGGRCACPLHNSPNKNFKVYSDGFYCFSCTKGGNLIDFVSLYFDLTFKEALQKIDADFSLGLYAPMSTETYNKYSQIAHKQKAEKEQRELKWAGILKRYWDALDEWQRLDLNKQIYKPKSDEAELHPLFIEAMQKLSTQEILLGRIESEVMEFDW